MYMLVIVLHKLKVTRPSFLIHYTLKNKITNDDKKF